MRQVVHLVLLAIAVIVLPRVFGLIDSESSILAHAMWGGIFGGVCGPILWLVVSKVFDAQGGSR
jgi:hypothetical protein